MLCITQKPRAPQKIGGWKGRQEPTWAYALFYFFTLRIVNGLLSRTHHPSTDGIGPLEASFLSKCEKEALAEQGVWSLDKAWSNVCLASEVDTRL